MMQRCVRIGCWCFFAFIVALSLSPAPAVDASYATSQFYDTYSFYTWPYFFGKQLGASGTLVVNITAVDSVTSCSTGKDVPFVSDMIVMAPQGDRLFNCNNN